MAKRKREPNRRSHGGVDGGGGTDVSHNPASNGSGESIGTLQFVARQGVSTVGHCLQR